MQYKDYIWPHNPKTYTISYERKVAVHKVPFGRYVMQDLGLGRRVMRGEGEFYGDGAYGEFKKLASVFYYGGPGTLIHPVWQSANAYFVELSLAQEPRKDYVKYTFTFWEDDSNDSQTLKPVGTAAASGSLSAGGSVPASAQYHTVVQGETLWGIAQGQGITLGELLVLNPQLKNPNVIQSGQQIRVR